MIECKSCKHKYEFKERSCPLCRTPMNPSAEEILAARRALDRAISSKDFEYVTMYRAFLADVGDVDSCREYAKLLEKSASAENKSIDLAMNYYKRAAENNDPYSAYKYSRLVERTSSVAAEFWLKYALTKLMVAILKGAALTNGETLLQALNLVEK